MEDQKQCMVSRMAVAKGFQIRHFLRAAPEDGLLSGWVFLFGDEDAKYSGNFDNYVTVKLKTIIEHNPVVAPYLDFPDGAEFVIDDNSGQVVPLHQEPEPPSPEPEPETCAPEMEPEPKEETGQAPPSEPENIPQDRNIPENQEAFRQDFQPRRQQMPKVSINPLVWMQHYPLWPAVIALCWIPPVFVMLFYSFLAGAILLGICFIAKILYWNSVYARFRNARMVPAIVVSTSPPLAAVTMNLSRGQIRCPAVKIAGFPVTKAEMQNLKKGLRLPAVAKRHGKEDEDGQPNWEDISFVLMNCASGDKDAMTQVLRGFTDRQWQELESRLDRIPAPHEEGLFKLPGK